MRRDASDEIRFSPLPRGGPQALGARCDECPLKGRRPVLGDGDPQAKLAIIGEAPGGNETDKGVPFIGRSGELLDLYLMKLGTHRKHVWLDNAVACMPPDADMKAFLSKAKKELGEYFRQPVDCCRPRLFNALKVPKCGACHKWLAGPDDERCSCKASLKPSTKSPVEVLLYVGNFAMESLHGHQGISAKRGYVDWNGLPQDRPIPSQAPNGKRLPVAAWVKKWTTTTPAGKPAASSAPPPTSKKLAGKPSRTASASGRSSSSGTSRASSSSPPPRRAGKKR